KTTQIMKHMTKILAMLFLVGIVTLTACKKDVKTSADEISQETLAKIANVGFSTTDVKKIDEGYLVEGDIILTEADLAQRPASPSLRIAEEEQYNTNNLVRISGATRTINVSASGNVGSALSQAIN